ncbi:Nucleoside-diphosphate-sugar epimerase [Fodinibius roseus]|uniref:Nucleoside-diphosphate-sugar epimerase n=1 Tax=Fodinibius roseus TaxID=1194090 RepID=A0A1M5IST3_9BACT|nr:NAD-dependent epimerase/dehydratase family protein [Fodinibius roseus]SHG31316.1 Nucleoside-diphosphate-sugar epimerase [Fodinibius roseus]
MQTILGAGGAIGRELAKALKEYTNEIRLVSRNPEKVNPTDELVAADLLNPDEVRSAVEGTSVAYVTVGLPYDAEVWEKKWPVLINNVLAACKEHNCKLVFFDNIYMYDEHHLNGMTEETPVNPPSRKGKVRARVANMIMEEAKEGGLKALIARSADFYGPNIKDTSMLTEMVVNPLSEGKKANWIGSAAVKHSFTYTPDAGKATALLGNRDEAYNQVWHLPTAAEPPTGKGWIEGVSREMGVKARYREVSKLMVRVMGLFVPVMSEIVEMYYQYDRDYVFDSRKFEQRFAFKPTPYREGIKNTVQAHDADTV